MKHIRDLVPSELRGKAAGKTKTERGELMRFFVTHLNAGRAKDKLPLITMSRMGLILQGIPTKDLYYLKSVCDKAKHFSKKFWWEIDPKKHQADNPF